MNWDYGVDGEVGEGGGVLFVFEGGVGVFGGGKGGGV